VTGREAGEGLQSSAVTDDDQCEALLHRGTDTIRCDLPARHEGSHSGHTDRSYVDWSVGPTDDDGYWLGSVTSSTDEELTAEYAGIDVERCIYCEAVEVVTAFVFLQPQGQRIAVPGRVGLCEDCHRLLRGGDVDAVLERTRGTSLDDFTDDAVVELIRASRDALPR
jgi:hypothetical protein